jgi:hypothetical protein
MQVEWLDPGPRWDALLAALPHDFYHLPGYATLCAEVERGAAKAIVCSRDGASFLLPLILRQLPEPGLGADVLDATSPYGYPGPLLRCPDGWDGARRAGFVRDAVAAFKRSLHERGVVSAFLRLHPLLGIPPAALAGTGELVRHGDTVSVDLTADAGGIWSGMRGNHRNGIAKAIRAGHEAGIDAHWDHLDVFVAAYHATMDRVGASRSYYFPRAYYPALRRALGGRIHLGLARIGGRVASAALFTEIGGIVQYHLGGTFDEFLRWHPHKLLFHRVMLWAKERGNHTFHLGGGVGGRDDSLFHFKAGFSPRRHAFHTWRVIADETSYARAVEASRQHHGEEAMREPSGFFPIYRMPPAGAAGEGGAAVRTGDPAVSAQPGAPPAAPTTPPLPGG